MVMGYYDNKLRKKVNSKVERAQILRKEKEVMLKSRRK